MTTPRKRVRPGAGPAPVKLSKRTGRTVADTIRSAAMSVGDRVWHSDDPETFGTITAVQHRTVPGGQHEYVVQWDDGTASGQLLHNDLFYVS